MGKNRMFMLYFCSMNLEIIYIKNLYHLVSVIHKFSVYIIFINFVFLKKMQTQCLRFRSSPSQFLTLSSNSHYLS